MNTQMLARGIGFWRASVAVKLGTLCVALLCALCVAGHAQEPKARFVGSESCKSCHAATYASWKGWSSESPWRVAR
jgi:hypothetical protein